MRRLAEEEQEQEQEQEAPDGPLPARCGGLGGVGRTTTPTVQNAARAVVAAACPYSC